jgi:hypothetical protein
MKTLAKEFGFGIWNVRTMLRPHLLKEYHKSTTYMSWLYRWLRGSNDRPQNSYTATDQEKLRNKGVWSSFYNKQM